MAPTIVRIVKFDHTLAGTLLGLATPTAVVGGVLRLTLPREFTSFHARELLSPRHATAVIDAVREVLGISVQLDVSIDTA